jgi:hypothetical protein
MMDVRLVGSYILEVGLGLQTTFIVTQLYCNSNLTSVMLRNRGP